MRSQTQVLQIHLEPAEHRREGAGCWKRPKRPPKRRPTEPTRPSGTGCKSHRGIVKLGTAAGWQDKSTLVRLDFRLNAPCFTGMPAWAMRSSKRPSANAGKKMSASPCRGCTARYEQAQCGGAAVDGEQPVGHQLQPCRVQYLHRPPLQQRIAGAGFMCTHAQLGTNCRSRLTCTASPFSSGLKKRVSPPWSGCSELRYTTTCTRRWPPAC